MPYDTKAAAVTPPAEGKNLIVLNSATSSARLKFPKSWRKSIITVFADGVDVYVTFGGTSASAVITAVTTLTSEAPSAHATGICWKIPAGGQKDFDLSLITLKNGGDEDDQKNLRMAHIESTTGGYLRIQRSSGPTDLDSTGLV